MTHYLLLQDMAHHTIHILVDLLFAGGYRNSFWRPRSTSFVHVGPWTIGLVMARKSFWERKCVIGMFYISSSNIPEPFLPTFHNWPQYESFPMVSRFHHHTKITVYIRMWKTRTMWKPVYVSHSLLNVCEEKWAQKKTNLEAKHDIKRSLSHFLFPKAVFYSS